MTTYSFPTMRANIIIQYPREKVNHFLQFFLIFFGTSPGLAPAKEEIYNPLPDPPLDLLTNLPHDLLPDLSHDLPPDPLTNLPPSIWMPLSAGKGGRPFL